MMRLSSVIALLVISSHSQELEPQRLLQVRPVKKNHDFGVMMMMLITMMTMKQKRASHLNDAASNCGGSHGFSVRQTSTMIKSAAILSQWQWLSEVSQFYHDFYVMIKSAAILTNINDDQKCRILS